MRKVHVTAITSHVHCPPSLSCHHQVTPTPCSGPELGSQGFKWHGGSEKSLHGCVVIVNDDGNASPRTRTLTGTRGHRHRGHRREAASSSTSRTRMRRRPPARRRGQRRGGGQLDAEDQAEEEAPSSTPRMTKRRRPAQHRGRRR
jgi:hypothetical protein